MTSKAFDNATDANRQQGGRRNLIINGAMQVAQRGTSATVTNAADYFLMDRYKHYRNSGGTLDVEQSTESPAGFKNSYKLTATSGVSVGSSQLNFFQQQIEGTNCYQLNLGTSDAVDFTVSFWVRSSVTGTYSIAVANSAVNRSLVKTYSISSADTWEYKTITIAGDTSGTWLTDTGTGLRLYFNLGSGSTYHATEDVWNASLELATSGTVDWFNNTGATFYLTGVQLEVGTVATPFEHRSYGEELALCQRYFEGGHTGNNYWMGVGDSSSGNNCSGARWAVEKRASPTCEILNISEADGSGFTDGTLTIFTATQWGFNRWSSSGGSSVATGRPYRWTMTIDAEL